MFVYLVEVSKCDDTEIIAIVDDFDEALTLLCLDDGLVTKMEIGKVYPQGIGICEHWHVKLGMFDKDK